MRMTDEQIREAAKLVRCDAATRQKLIDQALAGVPGARFAIAHAWLKDEQRQTRMDNASMR